MTAIHTTTRIATATLASALLLAGALQPAFAEVSDPEAKKPVTTAEADAKPKAPAKHIVYCVKETITGSIIPRKTCKSREDWIAETGVDPAKL